MRGYERGGRGASSGFGMNYNIANSEKQKVDDEGRRIIYEEKNGGMIVTENPKPNREERENIEALKTFAEQGEKIVLLKTSDKKGHRSADCTRNGIIWEVKTNKTPTSSAIDSELRSCNGQSENLILNLVSGISKDKVVKGINARIHRTNIKKIVIEINGKVEGEYNRNDFIKK